MDAEDEERRRIIARLEHALQRPDAFQLLVDSLPRANAILGLKIWGSLRGLYVETPPMPRASDTVPGAPGPVEEGGTPDRDSAPGRPPSDGPDARGEQRNSPLRTVLDEVAERRGCG